METQLKKKILIGVGIAAGVIVLGVGIWFIIFLSQFKVYSDQDYRFSIKYPSAWKLIPHPQPGAAAAFVTPKENAFDTFQENVNVTLEDMPMDIATVKGLTDKIILQMTKVFNNMKVLEQGSIEFGGRKGYRVLFAAEKPDHVRILTAFTIKGADRAYILMYMAEAKNYQKYLPQVEEMIRSFQLR